MAEEQEYDLITTVVEQGEADRVVRAALEAGAPGATILDGRGTGVRQRLGALGWTIKPEKEIILIVTPREITDAVFQTLVKAARLEESGRGFAYVHEVSKAAGFPYYLQSQL